MEETKIEPDSQKFKILMAALNLFSEKGYDSVSVDEIARSVGVTGPSIYKHFKGKEALLDELIAFADASYEKNFGSERNIQIPSSTKELVNMSLGQLNYTMHDPTVKKVRRIFAMEQFRNQKIGEMATKYFITGLENMYTKVFKEMVKQGTVRKENPNLLATEYIYPVSVLIHEVDRRPESEEEAMKKIKRHFQQFVKIYGVC